MGRSHWDRGLAAAVDVAITNVVSFGDTDLFPDAPEQLILSHRPDAARRAVLDLHRQFDAASGSPPKTEALRALFPAGALGYRIGTQIEPVWNLYLLALVILAAPDIENARQSLDGQIVHSYRYRSGLSGGRIFDPEIGWRSFTKRTVELCQSHASVVVCDLADFYHRIDAPAAVKALIRCGVARPLVARIDSLLRRLGSNSLGLPIGGPASRLIAEAVLADLDKLLTQNHIVFCRFVDDYRIFAAGPAPARAALALLSQATLVRGLSVQKAKTRLLDGSALQAELALGAGSGLSPSKAASVPAAANLRDLISQPAHFDPYSGLRAQRDERLETFASQPGALTLLKREFSKPQINAAIARNLLSAIAYLTPAEAADTLQWLLSPPRRPCIQPVLGKLLSVIGEQVPRLDSGALPALRRRLLGFLGATEADDWQLLTMLSLVVRCLQAFPSDPSPAVQDLLSEQIASTDDTLLQRELILLMGVWNYREALDLLCQGPRLSSAWTRRALHWALAQSKFLSHRRGARSVPVPVWCPGTDPTARLVAGWLASHSGRVTMKTVAAPRQDAV
jgi:hypothetical protein